MVNPDPLLPTIAHSQKGYEISYISRQTYRRNWKLKLKNVEFYALCEAEEQQESRRLISQRGNVTTIKLNSQYPDRT